MAVPKTSVNLDDRLAGWDHDIGAARQIAIINTKSQTETTYDVANPELWRRAASPDPSHQKRPLRFREDVSHCGYGSLDKSGSASIGNSFRSHLFSAAGLETPRSRSNPTISAPDMTKIG